MDNSQPMLDFPLLARTPLAVDFSGGVLSSDGGLLLLAQLDRRLGLTERVAACIHDARLPERVTHPLLDLIRQRIFQIAAGYEDCLDANRLRGDPALKVAVGRRPISDADLACQSTLSRLESMVAEAECEAINAVLLSTFLEQPRPRVREVILDVDTSEDKTHGQQEFAEFNAYYGDTCYLPRFVFARVSGESEEYLIHAHLPDTHAYDPDDLITTLASVVTGIRARWPGVRLVLRADAWFGAPELYQWLDTARVAYTIAIPANAVLNRAVAELRQQALAAASAAEEMRSRRFGKFWYQAEGWNTAREVVAKVEVTPHTTSVRFVLVEGIPGSARRRYQFYGGRGESENRIKELKGAIKSDRTSCMDFASNKVRLTFAAVAYVLLQGLRRVARQTGLARAQVETLRLALIKIAAQVKETTRRVKVALCRACPTQELWRRLARRLGVTVT